MCIPPPISRSTLGKPSRMSASLLPPSRMWSRRSTARANLEGRMLKSWRIRQPCAESCRARRSSSSIEEPSRYVVAAATSARSDAAIAEADPGVASMQRANGTRIGAGNATDASHTFAALARAARSGDANASPPVAPLASRAQVSAARATSRPPPCGKRPASAASAGNGNAIGSRPKGRDCVVRTCTRRI